MQTTRPLCGAMRFPLTTKGGRQDWYKGTGQARIPGSAARSGRPGVHVTRGTGKFEILDEKVRFYVAPPIATLNNTTLEAYVPKRIRERDASKPMRFIASFSPEAIKPNWKRGIGMAKVAPGEGQSIRTFHKEYQKLSPAEKEAIKMQARREWWVDMQLAMGQRRDRKERAKKDRAEESAETNYAEANHV